MNQNKYVVSHVVKAIVNSGLEELSDQLKTVYSKDMVDKKICGELDTNLSVMKDGMYIYGYIDKNVINEDDAIDGIVNQPQGCCR